MNAPYLSGTTGTISGSNALTTLPVTMPDMGGQGGVLTDASALTLAVANDGTAKTITGGTVVFSEAVGAQTVSITYTLPNVSIANNASQVFQVALSSGYLKDCTVNLTFATAPTAGSASVQAVVRGPGGNESRGAKSPPAAVTVGTTATLVKAANPGRSDALLVNNGSATVYLGRDNTVTTSNGIPLAAGASLEDDASGDAWYGIVASGTCDIRVLEVA